MDLAKLKETVKNQNTEQVNKLAETGKVLETHDGSFPIQNNQTAYPTVGQFVQPVQTPVTRDADIPLPTKPEDMWPNNQGKYFPMFPQQPDPDEPMIVFKSHIPNVKYIFPNGKEAPFINGRFATNVKDEVIHLAAECGQPGKHLSRHPMIYIDENDWQTTAKVDPLEELKAKLRAELRAEMAVATNPLNDMGNTGKPEKLNVMNSRSIGELASGSASGASPIPAGK